MQKKDRAIVIAVGIETMEYFLKLCELNEIKTNERISILQRIIGVIENEKIYSNNNENNNNNSNLLIN